MNIGRAIKELRTGVNMSQSELAEKCGLTQTTLSQIETGSKRPNSSTMKRLSDFFGLPEAGIYLLATEESDIPEHKRKLFEKLFPNIKNSLIDILRQ